MTDAAILERLAIRELHEAYADAVLRHDAEAWSNCWCDDATWTLFGTAVRGRAAITAFWIQAMAGFQAVSFIAMPAALVIDGDHAHGRAQTHEVLREAGGRSRVVGGAYDDHFVRENGRWLFNARDFRIVAQYPGERP